MKDLILFRGLPGAGKSTLAETLCDVAYSADDFFIQPDGAYVYDKSRIKEAHEYCLLQTLRAMSQSVSRVGVANTFTQAWEMDAYYKAAYAAGYRVHAVIVEGRGRFRCNIHGTPLDVIERMEERFQVVL